MWPPDAYPTGVVPFHEATYGDPSNNPEDVPTTSENVVCKCPRSLERCERLQELKITAITNNRFTHMGHILYDENIHGEFDKLLEPFADVRGLGEVFFYGETMVEGMVWDGGVLPCWHC